MLNVNYREQLIRQIERQWEIVLQDKDIRLYENITSDDVLD